jgi:ribosomal protein S18 acetylase RimI-like enzyme
VTHLIRPAQSSDLSELAEVFEEYRNFYQREPLDRKCLLGFLTDLLDDPRRARQSVLVFEGKIVGFSTLYFTFSSLSAKKATLLNDLFVQPKLRQLGYGRLLLKEALSYSNENGYAYLQLETAQDNFAAQRLYEAEGGVRSHFFIYEFEGLKKGP